MSDGTLERSLVVVARVLRPLATAVSTPGDLEKFLRSFGFSMSGVDLAKALEALDSDRLALEALASAVQDFVVSTEGRAPTFEDLYPVVSAVPNAIAVVYGLGAALGELADRLPADFASEVFELLLVTYLVMYHDALHRLAVLLGIVEYRWVRQDSSDAEARDIDYQRVRLHWERLVTLFRDPVELVRDSYGWGTTDFAGNSLIVRVQSLAEAMGLEGWVENLDVTLTQMLWPEGRPADAPVALISPLWSTGDDETSAVVGLLLTGAGPTAGSNGLDSGLSLMPFAEGQVEHTIGLSEGLTLEVLGAVELSGGPVFVVRPRLFELIFTAPELSSNNRIGLRLLKSPAPGTDRIVVISVGGIGVQAAGVFVECSGTPHDLELAAGIRGGSLTVAPDDPDGFLDTVLPRDGITARFDVVVGWSKSEGVRLHGSGGLELAIPVNGGSAGIDVRAVHVSVTPLSQSLAISFSLTAALRLGPVVLAISEMGLVTRLNVGTSAGNLGPLNLGIDFKPPTGVGISIDSGAVTGGGFLSFDPAREQYAGGLHLEFSGISLNAFGLLTTRLPDGSKGFSLLILVQASGFEPVPLGFGFTLTGVGGLLGINRTVNIEVLRAGVRSRVLDSILFCPDDPTPRAGQIVSTLNTVFPPARDRFVFGPMVQLAWGTPTLVTVEVALILELPSPLRLIVLGRLHAFLPVAEAAIVQLHLDAVGVLDFEKREASVDATLYDSFVGPFSLSGDMALRVSWGTQPEFALSIGGFHPAYKPPAGFPALRRLTLALATGDNPRVRAEAYLAVTANTLQLGARLDLRVEAAGFVLEGGMGFDALVTRVPFGFEVDIAAYLALKRGASTIMGISLRAHLTGPNPWHLKGSVSFTILFFSVTIGVDATFGDARQLPAVQQEPIWPKLEEALAAAGNWAAELPTDAGRLAVLSPGPANAGEVVVHPLGAVRVLQRIVPLERTIARFGAAPPQDYARFAITQVLGAQRDSLVYDNFAPAQFLEMSDAEKLSAPGFELMPAGVRLRAPDDAHAYGTEAIRLLRYQTIAIGGPATGTRFTPDVATIGQQAERGAAASAATRTTGRAKYGVDSPPPRTAEPAFAVAGVSDLKPTAGVTTDGTYSAGLEAARARPDVQVVRLAELVP